MLIVGIFAGLASQMNQYAFARVLQKRYPKADVRLVDGCEWLKDFGHNGYELDRVFGIERDSVDIRLIKRLANFYPAYGLKAKAFNALYQLRDKVIGPRTSQIQMNDLQPDSPILTNLDLTRDWLFWGNCAMWTFAEAESELRSSFSFVEKLAGENSDVAAEMMQTNSVSVHVRRGDYLKFGYKLLGEAYYRQAMTEIEKRVADPTYYVFSDDLSVARKLFEHLPAVRFVQGNTGPSSYMDMQLMSCCRHNIIANSGFSAVAAWLNRNPNKVVVGPGTGILSRMPGYVLVR